MANANQAYWKGGTNAQWNTAANWRDSDGVQLGGVGTPRIPQNGESVFMLHSDIGTPAQPAGVGTPNQYCTTGPTVAVTIADLKITLPASLASNPSILSSNGGNVTISLTFSLVEDATAGASLTIFGAILGGAASRPILASPAVGSVIAQPSNAYTGGRSVNIDVHEGASLSGRARDYTNAGDMGWISLCHNGSIMAGVIIIVGNSGPGIIIGSGMVTGTAHIEIRAATAYSHTFLCNGSARIDISAPTRLGPLVSTAYWSGDGMTINVAANSPTTIYGLYGQPIISGNVTVNALSPIVLDHAVVAAGKTLTINAAGYSVTSIYPSPTGTVTINGGAVNERLMRRRC